MSVTYWAYGVLCRQSSADLAALWLRHPVMSPYGAAIGTHSHNSHRMLRIMFISSSHVSQGVYIVPELQPRPATVGSLLAKTLDQSEQVTSQATSHARHSSITQFTPKRTNPVKLMQKREKAGARCGKPVLPLHPMPRYGPSTYSSSWSFLWWRPMPTRRSISVQKPTGGCVKLAS